jgi:EpsI family protein
MTRRVLVLLALLLAAGIARGLLLPAAPVAEADLDAVPFELGTWRGRRGADLTPDVAAALAAGSYINRAYANEDRDQANVFIGYYATQRHGSAIHSPLNCLPGAGWGIENIERVAFGDSWVRRVLIRKGTERLLVVYWYHTATRIEGEEYRARLHSVIDNIRARRNDAAFVRVTVPVGTDIEGEVRATHQAFELAALLQPHVQRVLFDTDASRALARTN